MSSPDLSPTSLVSTPAHRPMPSEKPPARFLATGSSGAHLDDLPNTGLADAVSRAHRQQWSVRAAPRVEGLRVEQRCDLTQRGAVLVAATALTVTGPRVGWARPTVNPMTSQRRWGAGSR
jgi:hypothetical protein